MAKMNVGDTVRRKGFFTRAKYLREQPGSELEQRLGFGTGRLKDGWWLLFMTELPSAVQFDVAGYTHLSGGVIEGHLRAPSDTRTAEQRLRDTGVESAKIKAGMVNDAFTLYGAERLAKVVPVARAIGADDYPQGTGFPQWCLTVEKPWKVAAFIRPGLVYRGNYV